VADTAVGEQGNDDLEVQGVQKSKRTLYEILGAESTDTKEELKKKYTTLAKICHPDAVRTRMAEGAEDEEIPDFTEIAAAWRILSDKKQRKRYDRSIQAEEFSDNLVRWVGDMAKQAAPVVGSFGNAANNILRKTTASTLAGVQAAATEVGKTNEQNATAIATADPRNPLSDALKSAAEAARIAGRAVDGMELLEKSQKLEERAMNEFEEAKKAKEDLQRVVERRLRMSLHTPGSGLSSAEANVILEDFSKTIPDDLSAWDLVMLRRTVEFEIRELQNEESAFVEAQVADTKAQDNYQECVQNGLKAQQELTNAQIDEEAARIAYLAAQERVVKAKEDCDSTTQVLSQAESQVKKSDWEIEVRSVSLERQSEKVRQALKQKERQVRKELGMDASPVPDKGGVSRLQELNDLRDEERLKAEASNRLQRMADRLQSRAQELRERAEELEV